jgi:serine/threonine protein kinase
VNIATGQKVAIKLESKASNLRREYNIYRLLDGVVGVPKVHWFGKDGKYYVLVLDILGPSLNDVFKYCRKKFTLKTILMIADEMIIRLQSLHQKNFIHCDLKPANFLLGSKLKEINMIDFGLSQRYYDETRKKHIRRSKGNSFTGTPRYASINAHLGIQLSRRDDLESLGYVLIYLYKGFLPWQGLKGRNKAEKHQQIYLKKMKTTPEELCSVLPPEFATYLNYCRSIRFSETPNYDYLRQLFRDVYFREGYSVDGQFDWNVKKAGRRQQRKNRTGSVTISRTAIANPKIKSRKDNHRNKNKKNVHTSENETRHKVKGKPRTCTY